MSFFTVTQVRKKLSCSAQSVRRYIQNGKLDGYQDEGGRWLATEESVLNFIKGNSKPQVATVMTQPVAHRSNNVAPVVSFQGANSVNSLTGIKQFRSIWNEYWANHYLAEDDVYYCQDQRTRPSRSELHEFIITKLIHLDNVSKYRLSVFSPDLQETECSDEGLGSWLLWQLPDEYEMLRKVDFYDAYYNYRQRLNRWERLSFSAYWVLFFNNEFVIRTQPEVYNSALNDSVAGADNSIDSDIKRETIAAMVDGLERMAEAIKSYRQPPVPPTVDLVKLVKDG